MPVQGSSRSGAHDLIIDAGCCRGYSLGSRPEAEFFTDPPDRAIEDQDACQCVPFTVVMPRLSRSSAAKSVASTSPVTPGCQPDPRGSDEALRTVQSPDRNHPRISDCTHFKRRARTRGKQQCKNDSFR